jgi:hypothetical protein
MQAGSIAGFKYFDCKGVRGIRIKVRGYCKGDFLVSTTHDGAVLARIPVVYTNVWVEYSAELSVPDGVHALYFRYEGEGRASFLSFTLV